MTHGQQRAVRELERLKALSDGAFEFSLAPDLIADHLTATISVRMGLMEARAGGLEFFDSEDFCLLIPPGFPFDRPSLLVTHSRFAGFPHVCWKYHLCLYQSSLEWNPSDGLFGFLERLNLWLRRAALNDMDPLEGPLEPPHHTVDSSLKPFVIRANAPVPPGQSWLGLAELKNYENRIEVVGWDSSFESLGKGLSLALAVVLPEALPMEFPSNGAEFFAELEKQRFDRTTLIRRLALAALLAPKGEPVYLIIGLPMRRAADGTPRLHMAVWAADAETADDLRQVIGSESDSEQIKEIREKMAELLYKIFSAKNVRWCRVLEDRPEIVVRRDAQSGLAWFLSKHVLILGCGALGSWTAEMIARAGASSLDLVDTGIVKPGLLARQNFTMGDIGNNKAIALKTRLQSLVASPSSVNGFPADAHGFALEDKARFSGYDVVLDCTASHIIQMKFERDWLEFDGATPPFISLITDANSQRGIFVSAVRNSPTGPWSAFVQLKHHLCTCGGSGEILDAFYDPEAMKGLFQPEPGCSDPTFSGSTADAAGIASTALNLATLHSLHNHKAVGVAFTLSAAGIPTTEIVPFEEMDAVRAGHYQVRISKKVHAEARGWVRQNNRIRTPDHETGGLLWGLWDDAIGVIWIFDASGPPPDSIHDPGHFLCGIVGTAKEHERRLSLSRGTSGFIGFWHTHPDMRSVQSTRDIHGMAGLVSALGQNQKRSLMLIYGRHRNNSTAGVYAYESQTLIASKDVSKDLVSVGEGQLSLQKRVV